MINDMDTELIACAKTLREAVNGAEVTVTRRVTFNTLNTEPQLDYCVYFGDMLNRGPWKWECAQGKTLQAAFDAAMTLIVAQGDERERERTKLAEKASKLGFKLVEVGA